MIAISSIYDSCGQKALHIYKLSSQVILERIGGAVEASNLDTGVNYIIFQ